LLIIKGVSYEDDIYEGKSPIYWAVKNSHYQIICALCDHPCIDPISIASAQSIMHRYDEIDFECTKRFAPQESKQVESLATKASAPIEDKESNKTRFEIEKIWGLKSYSLKKLHKKWDAMTTLSIRALVNSGFYSEENTATSEDDEELACKKNSQNKTLSNNGS
jgi:hypothetical protein